MGEYDIPEINPNYNYKIAEPYILTLMTNQDIDLTAGKPF